MTARLSRSVSVDGAGLTHLSASCHRRFASSEAFADEDVVVVVVVTAAVAAAAEITAFSRRWLRPRSYFN